MTARPAAALLSCGTRLHLHHGPIDLIIGADAQAAAFEAAIDRFDTVLTGLVAELPLLRRPVGARPDGPVARRMWAAVRPHRGVFVTSMAAVAGAVADEVLAAMRAATPLARAYVNNGGDIALYLARGQTFTIAMPGQGRITLRGGDGIGGVATSGQGGRSLSRGIADSVTVLARDAARADVAATLIANAVDLPGHAAITRTPAHDLDPDSDLGARPVVTHVGALSADDIAAALDAGAARARGMIADGLIAGAALTLRGARRTPVPTRAFETTKEAIHA